MASMTATNEPKTLYRFRIDGGAGNGVLRAVDEADHSSVFLVRIPPDRIVNPDAAIDLARQIGERSSREVFSDRGVIYFVADRVGGCQEIIENCTAGGLLRSEAADVGSGHTDEVAIPVGTKWSANRKFLVGLGALFAIFVIVSHLGNSGNPSEGNHSGTNGSVAGSSDGEVPIPKQDDFVSGSVGEVHYGSNAISVGDHTVGLYGIGPISSGSSGELLAYLAKNPVSLHCNIKTGTQYICTYMDQIYGERDFSRIVVRFGAAYAADDAPAYLKADQKYAKLHKMGVWNR